MSPEVNGKNLRTNDTPASPSGLHLELSQLEFLTKYPNSKMTVLAPWRRFVSDKKARKGFYDFIRSIQKDTQKLGTHTDERQIVNADIERQLNDIFGKRCTIKICKPEEHNLLKHQDGTYSVAMLKSSTAKGPTTIYISELLLRSQDGHVQTKLHYQTALCELVVGLILCREKLDKQPNKISSKVVKALCTKLLTREKKNDFENRCAVVMYTFSMINLLSFLKSPNTLTWIPSLDSILRGGKASLEEAQESGYSVAIAWPKIKNDRRLLLNESFDQLLIISEEKAAGSHGSKETLVTDSELREGAVAAKYIAQFIGLRNPVQTCEAALYSAFTPNKLEALQKIYNIKISPRAKALVESFYILKSEPFDICPKLEVDKANHLIDYQQALLMQKCVELSKAQSNDKKFHPSDLMALYLAAKTADIGTLSDKATKKNYAKGLDHEARFTLLPLMERLNVSLFNELGYLLLRAFDHDLTSKLKDRVSMQCAGLNLPERKTFLSSMLDIAKLVPDCRAEVREKTYYSLSDKHDESESFVRAFAKEYKISEIDKLLNEKIPGYIINLLGQENHFVDELVNKIVTELSENAVLDRADSSELEKFNKIRRDLYKHVFLLIRNTDNLGLRLISANPAQAIVSFYDQILLAVAKDSNDLSGVSRITKPEGRRVNLNGEWIIERLQIEVKPKNSPKSIYLELEVHAITDGVYKDQKLGLGLFKYAFAHWVMKVRRSVCRENKIDENKFAPYSGVIPLQKDPQPTTQHFYEHFELLWKSLSRQGTYHRVKDEVILIPSWDSNPAEAVKATNAYRRHFPDQMIASDSTSVYSQVAFHADSRLKIFQRDFGEFGADVVEDLLIKEALSRIASSLVPYSSDQNLPADFANWVKHYYVNILGIHPLQVYAGLIDDSLIQNAKGNPKSTSQIILHDLWTRAKKFFAISEVKMFHSSEQLKELAIDANADLMGFHNSIFKIRQEICNELGISVPIVKKIIDRSTDKHPNALTISFGRPADVAPEQFKQFFVEFQKRIRLNLLPLNAKNTKKSTYTERIIVTALDHEHTLLSLYELAEKHGISIEHIRATTGEGIEDAFTLAKFDMRLSAILKESDINEDSSENTQRVQERFMEFVQALCDFVDPKLGKKVFNY